MSMVKKITSPSISLAPAQVKSFLEQVLGSLSLDGKRVLVIIPDGTRSAPIPLLFPLINDLLLPFSHVSG